MLPARCHLLLFIVPCVLGQSPVPRSSGSAVALARYAGKWQITHVGAPETAKPDVLQNDCSAIGRYFACQQTTNGNAGGLLVFVPTTEPGHFYTQTILPEGRATGRDELRINGDQWIYSSRRDQNGRTTFFRNVNTFTGRNQIHFEQAQSANGSDWMVQATGDEIRLGPTGKPLH